MEIAICVITYRRPEGLTRLLAALTQQTFDGPPPKLRIVIVDNDPEGSAKAVCQAPPNGLPGKLEYYIESQRGIPYARNSAVAHALPTADFIVFVDDDEEPVPTWLAELLRVQGEYKAHVVSGPVPPRFAPEVPAWIRKGGLFEHPRYRTGEALTTAGTGNVLIDAVVFREMEEHFDTAFALRGGSDRQFMHRVRLAGYRLVWADEAIAYEWVPRSRARAGWMLARFYSNGTANCATAIELGGGLITVASIVVKGAAFICTGLVLVPAALVKGRAAALRYLRYVAYGLGLWAGLLGRRPEQYRTIHGQ